ncbi:metallophosphoesterase [Steroidobacter agaridevorans]|uniref:metallophosphoesterase n=1 Tax=Steroidobacter agaridevorans TaxID=2695856 RepID=UPI00132AEB7D|nr:metallophosphoesterase [Steroidobacter agaridevorans]GFE87987.1 metallophosphoesterase [Steroidobacter agaridevorans]
MSHLLQILIAAVALAFGVGLAQAESLQDGPYVIRAADGSWRSRWVEAASEGPQVRDQAVEIGDAVTLAAVGSLPAFEVKLRAPAQPADDEIRVNPRTPIFVMADTHGEFEIAVQLLQRHGIIDERLRWSFGKGHLAVLGDVFDRGPNQTELLWLIYKLEAEAARIGGGVHLAIGNHESMVLTGDDRYLNPKYRRVAALLGADRYTLLWSEQTLLGQWLRSKAAVFRLGQYLCLHGGISRELVDRGLTLSAVNQTVRGALLEPGASADMQTEFVMGQNGPLWYRGYFQDAARKGGFRVAEQSDIELIRGRFGVKAILVGHTTVPAVTSLYGGRVIAVQVYPHRDEQTQAPVMEGLMIRKDGQMFRARVDGSSEMLPRS